MRRTLLFMIGLLAACPLAKAQFPTLGGPMKHILIAFDNNSIGLSFESPDEGPLTLHDYGETYSGAAAVLNDSAYNAQFGWLAGGFISLPPDGSIWIETLDATPGLETYDAFSFAPILGTDGSSDRWQWSGVMTHNWYAVRDYGFYEATYSVYIGDAVGQPMSGFAADSITLSWLYAPDLNTGQLGAAPGAIKPDSLARVSGDVGPTPAPGSAIALALGCLGVSRRRRS